MRIITLSICLIFIVDGLAAQGTIKDSLTANLANHPREDTVRVDIFNNLAFYYSTRDPGQGLRYADSAITLAMRLNDRPRLAAAYNYKGLNEVARGKDTIALDYFNQGLNIATARGDSGQKANLLHQIGKSYFNLSKYPLALQYQTQAFDLYQKLDDQPGMAAALNSTGVIFLYLSDYPNSLANFLRALDLYGQLKSRDNTGMGTVLANLGLVYDHLENYDTSLMYHFKALNIFRKEDQQYSMQNTLANIGNTYDDAGKPLKALEYYKQALTINEHLGNKRGIASDLINTGIVYYGMADYTTALVYLKKALTLYQEMEDKYGMGITYTYLSSLYSKAPVDLLAREGIKPSQRYAKALAAQQKGLALATEIKDLYSESEAWGNMSDLYKDQGNFKKSLEAYQKYVALHDSIFSHEKRLQISRMQMQYELDKHEIAAKAALDKSHVLAAAEIKKQQIIRNSILLGAGVLFIMIVISFIFYKRKHDAEERQKEAEMKARVTDTEMKALRAQMNPHFIFNSLNSISDYISKHDPEKADLYLSKFAKMMRMILEYSEQKAISLADDLKALELYMQLESLRLSNKFNYELVVDGQIDLENTMVPPLILQPFVENSIWHGIAKKNGKGKILIEIKKEKEMINCIVEDNGIGRKVSDKLSHPKKSFGMKLTESRIDIMNKSYGKRAAVRLSDLKEGLRVELQLPLILNF